MPTEPPPTRWHLPQAEGADPGGLVGVGADLEPGTLLAAYRGGLFPMPGTGGAMAWWSPDPRAVLPFEALRVSRSLRRSSRRYEIRVDTSFEDVMRACAMPGRDGAWITPDIIAAYTRLHELGWAHSIEAWDQSAGLVGGLYGVGVGGLFAGESMFHTARDASKVALLALVDRLRDGGATLLDVQWTTPHLRSLGAVDITRADYLQRLAVATSVTTSCWR